VRRVEITIAGATICGSRDRAATAAFKFASSSAARAGGAAGRLEPQAARAALVQRLDPRTDRVGIAGERPGGLLLRPALVQIELPLRQHAQDLHGRPSQRTPTTSILLCFVTRVYSCKLWRIHLAITLATA
jgi:hypothetical protein